MSAQITNSTTERFNAIRWHDSKLVGLAIYKAGEEDRVRISLELLGSDGSRTPAEIIFMESAYIEAEVYLQAKSMCSDDISDAECLESSDWKNTVSQPGPYDPIQGNRGFDELLHVRISMCAPGGAINILAKDFSIESSVSTRSNGN